MDNRMPNENEKKKLAAIFRNQGVLKRHALHIFYGVLLLIVIRRFLEHYPQTEFPMAIVTIALLLAIFYLVIKCEFFQKCPRCSIWGISLNGFLGTHKNCRRCGMLFVLSRKDPQKDSTTTAHRTQDE